jgi:uncharacterized membrane protein
MSVNFELCEDIGRHAAQEAIMSVKRICETVHDPVEQVGALAIAVAVLEWKIVLMKKELPAMSGAVDAYRAGIDALSQEGQQP